MDRRNFLRRLGLATTGAKLLASPETSAASEEPTASPVNADPFAFLAAPVLLNPSPDGVSIVCVFNAHAAGRVEYGDTETLGECAEGVASGGLRPCGDHLVFQLAGLRPGQRCFYRVHASPLRAADPFQSQLGGEIVSELQSFRTLDPSAGEINFTVWNDTHETGPTLARLIALHREQPGDFLFWNGDIFNTVSSRQSLIAQCFHPAGLAFADATPYFLTRGNHDVRGSEARLLPQLLNGPHGQYYYTFRHGPVGFLVLDTGEDKPDRDPSYAGLADFESYRSEQQRWLTKAIGEPAFASASIRVAFLHIPLVWEAEIPEHWPTVWNGHKGWITEDGFRKWNDLLTQAGVNLVISGHTHRHAWFPANKTRPYGQLIGGGPKPEQATVIRVKADARRLSFEVRDLQGNVVREGVLTV